MNKSIALLFSGCAMLLLAGCPKTSATSDPGLSKLCGSRGMEPCPSGQFCEFTAEAQCGMADAPGTCKPIPEVCTQEYVPVCGCDGKTYSNACMAAGAGVSVAHQGECKPQLCGGIAGIQCTAGMKCVDDPSDSCNPAHGGADCSGICQKE